MVNQVQARLLDACRQTLRHAVIDARNVRQPCAGWPQGIARGVADNSGTAPILRRSCDERLLARRALVLDCFLPEKDLVAGARNRVYTSQTDDDDGVPTAPPI